MENIFTMPQQDVRWIVPEIIRSAITLGMRQAPFYPEIIASDQSISGLSAIMPMINMSDAAPAKVNEAETIPLGDVSFGQKSVSLFKIACGRSSCAVRAAAFSLGISSVSGRAVSLFAGLEVFGVDIAFVTVACHGAVPSNF